MMRIKINDKLPETEFYKIAESGPKKLKSYDVFSNKKILLVGVPGAFTPTCSLEHLPPFIQKVKKFKSKGIDEIVFLSVNDPFVMSEWMKNNNADEINFLSDPFCEFGKKTGLTIDLSEIGLGLRLSRFAMIIYNNEVQVIFDEEGGGLDKSSADSILKAI